MRHHHPSRRAHLKQENGTSLIEYCLLLALIAIVVFSAVSFFGKQSGAGFGKSKDCIDAAYNGTLGNACPPPTTVP